MPLACRLRQSPVEKLVEPTVSGKLCQPHRAKGLGCTASVKRGNTNKSS